MIKIETFFLFHAGDEVAGLLKQFAHHLRFVAWSETGIFAVVEGGCKLCDILFAHPLVNKFVAYGVDGEVGEGDAELVAQVIPKGMRNLLKEGGILSGGHQLAGFFETACRDTVGMAHLLLRLVALLGMGTDESDDDQDEDEQQYQTGNEDEKPQILCEERFDGAAKVGGSCHVFLLIARQGLVLTFDFDGIFFCGKIFVGLAFGVEIGDGGGGDFVGAFFARDEDVLEDSLSSYAVAVGVNLVVHAGIGNIEAVGEVEVGVVGQLEASFPGNGDGEVDGVVDVHFRW